MIANVEAHAIRPTSKVRAAMSATLLIFTFVPRTGSRRVDRSGHKTADSCTDPTTYHTVSTQHADRAA
jgi:hypothetical protein